MVDSGEELGARVIVVGRRGCCSRTRPRPTRDVPPTLSRPEIQAALARAALAGRASQRHARRGPPVHGRARDEQRRPRSAPCASPRASTAVHTRRPQRGSRADRGRSFRAPRRARPGVVHRGLALEAAARRSRAPLAASREATSMRGRTVSGPREQREVAVAFNDMTDTAGRRPRRPEGLRRERVAPAPDPVDRSCVSGSRPRAGRRAPRRPASWRLQSSRSSGSRACSTSLLTLAREGDEPGLPRPVSLARAAEGAEARWAARARGKAARSSCAATATSRSPPPRKTWRSLLDNLIENALHLRGGRGHGRMGQGQRRRLARRPRRRPGPGRGRGERAVRALRPRERRPRPCGDGPRPRDRADARAPLEGTSRAREPRRRRRSGGGTVSQRMKRRLAILALALLGLFCAAGVGVAAYLVSRDSVAVPVTRLQPTPRELAPVRSQPRPKTTPNTAPAPPPPPRSRETTTAAVAAGEAALRRPWRRRHMA